MGVRAQLSLQTEAGPAHTGIMYMQRRPGTWPGDHKQLYSMLEFKESRRAQSSNPSSL